MSEINERNRREREKLGNIHDRSGMLEAGDLIYEANVLKAGLRDRQKALEDAMKSKLGIRPWKGFSNKRCGFLHRGIPEYTEHGKMDLETALSAVKTEAVRMGIIKNINSS